MNTAVATTPKKTLTNSIAKSEELVKLAEEITIISEKLVSIMKREPNDMDKNTGIPTTLKSGIIGLIDNINESMEFKLTKIRNNINTVIEMIE
ncbi:MAG: hypothetical protein IPN99_14170 [Bacteroidetes bacterium]|nr:hypothetical protein [Bacteroidota bacterium]